MLTPERIEDIATDYFADQGLVVRAMKMIEQVDAGVRKDDEALILLLVERLERADKISGYPNNKAAIKAGRARLEQP